MPVIKISQFPSMSQADVDPSVDILAIVDTSEVENKKITLNTLGSSITASYAVSSSHATTALSSSYALTASYALNGGGGGVSPTIFNNYTSSTNGWTGSINEWTGSIQSYFVYTTGSKDGSIQPVLGSNSTEQCFSTIAGGQNNSITDNEGASWLFIGGGESNTITDMIIGGFIGAGLNNCLSHVGGGTTRGASIVGGRFNTSSNSPNSFIGAGCNNQLNCATLGLIGSGNNNLITGSSCASSIVGGENNTINSSNHHNFIAGGQNNTISSSISSILGGDTNIINSPCSVILGGFNNSIEGTQNNFIGVGSNQIITSSRWSTIVNGTNNEIYCNLSTILNGVCNVIDGQCNTIGGGTFNTITSSADHSAIVGGERNIINTPNTFIGAGSYNTGSSTHGFIGAGGNNFVGFNEAGYSSVVGGCNNKVSTDYASILGGDDNCITSAGTAGAILGGRFNCLEHACSFIAGRSITSSADNTFHVNCLNIANLPTSDPGIPGTLYRTGVGLDEIKVSI